MASARGSSGGRGTAMLQHVGWACPSLLCVPLSHARGLLCSSSCPTQLLLRLRRPPAAALLLARFP